MTMKPFDQLMNALPLERTEPAVGIDFDPPILARGVGACYCFIKCWALCWFILLRGRSKLMPSENFRSFHLTRCLQPQVEDVLGYFGTGENRMEVDCGIGAVFFGCCRAKPDELHMSLYDVEAKKSDRQLTITALKMEELEKSGTALVDALDAGILCDPGQIVELHQCHDDVI
ncbi:hypothetical protein T01_12832 [Trichinella spiralis]|uniref:Uncharacterized protein n=1 Tax=Trichinella spiralis TaxID=6334 RepID=A0A0V1BDX5_TRISP|nr:hypothetical protein T01_12832 [Trichinella spiralis]